MARFLILISFFVVNRGRTVNFRGFIIPAVVAVCLVFSSTAQAERFSVEKDLSMALKQTSKCLDRALGKIDAGKSVVTEAAQLGQLRESILALDLLYAQRLQQQAEKMQGVGGLASSRQAAHLRRYRKGIQALKDHLVQALVPKGFTRSNLRILQEAIAPFLQTSERPIHGLLPYKNLNYPQLLPASASTVTPAYSLAGAAALPADTQGAPEAPVSAAIAAKAQELGWSPVTIYEWVKNNIKTEWYWGCMKGAEQTLLQGSGNDADQAALLVALLRAGGYPARYVRGTIEFFPDTVSTVVEQTGVADFAQIGELFRRAGIPYEAVNGDSNYRIEHIWVETKIPYANYRGMVADLHGEAWLPLDTSLKVAGYSDVVPAIDLVQDSNPANPLPTARDQYLSAAQTATPLGQLRADTQAFLDTNYSGQVYTDLLFGRTQNPERLSILPGRPQFKEVAVTGEYAALPNELLHTVRFNATLADASPVFDVTLNVHALSNRVITVSYEPESVEDQEIIGSWGGLANTPAYLVRVRPVLLVDGQRIVVGKAGLAFGETFNLQVGLNGPRGTTGYTNSVEAGYPQTIALVAQQALVPDRAMATGTAEALMHYQALDYIDQWNASEEELGHLLQVAVVRPVPAVTTVGGMLEVIDLLGVTQGVVWKGLFVDADLRGVEPVNRTQVSDGREQTFMQLSALEGSQLEAWIFEDPNGLFGVESISTAELFGLSNDQSVPIANIDPTNIDTVLQTLALPGNIAADIDDAVRNQGLTVRIPAMDITHHNWTGTGYIKENQATGEAGYMLSGALAGSSTVMGVEMWPVELVSALQSPFSMEPNSNPASAQWITKIQPQALRTATAGVELTSPLMVFVQDNTGVPVEGALVTFSVKVDGSEGYLVDDQDQDQTSLDVMTNRDGMAPVIFRAGEVISAASPIGYKGSGDVFTNIIGQNYISAQLKDGSLQSIASPFTVLVIAGVPDPANVTYHGDGRWGNTFGSSGSAGITFLDKFNNGVANWPVTFTALTAIPMTGSQCTDVGSYAPADKTELIDYFNDCFAGYGECPNAATSIQSYSSSFGYTAAISLLGGVPFAEYPIQITYSIPENGQIDHTVTHSNWSVGSCFGATAPDRYWMHIYDGRTNARPAGKPSEIDVLAYLLAEGEQVQSAADGGEYITCGQTSIKCDKIIGDGHYTVVEPTKVKINGQYVNPVSGGNEVVGLYRYNGTLPLGKNEISIESTVEKNDLQFNHGCDTCDLNGAEAVNTSFGPFVTTYTVWGVEVSISEDSILVPVDASGLSTQAITVNYQILPAEYSAGNAQVWLYRNSILEQVYVPTGGLTGGGFITIGPGYQFNLNAGYTFQIIINNPGALNEITSFEVPIQFGDTKTDGQPTMVERIHLLNQFDTPVPGVIGSPYIDTYQSFLVPLLNDSDVRVTLLGSNLQEKAELIPTTSLTAGNHKYLLTYEQVRSAGIDPIFDPEFYIKVEETYNNSTHITLTRAKIGERTTTAKTLGQTLVHDVLIQDGSLNLSRQDLSLKGRGPELSFSRNYSNQNSSKGFKPLGRGWSHSLDMRLRVLSTSDHGSSSVPGWVTAKEGVFFPASFVPPIEASTPTSVQVNGTLFKKDAGVWYAERGKHGRLTEITAGFEFTAKDGTLYRYDFVVNGEYYVTAIEDRNGNALTFAYDAVLGHLESVTDEVGRQLTLTTELISGIRDDNSYRVTSISGPDGIVLDYTYDAFGYLVDVKRGARSETYVYARETGIANADFNLVKAIDSNGYGYQYEYNAPGAVAAMSVYTGFIKSQDVIKSVTYPDDSNAAFTYDVATANKRIVNDLRGFDTTYTLNSYGNPTRIDEPLGKYTEMTWSIDQGLNDNVMTSKTVSAGTEASPRALTTYYEYDDKGNVAKETDPYDNFITSSWDQDYSLPLTRIDRNGVEQRWSYDPVIKGCLTKHEVEVIPGVFAATDSTCYATGEVETVTDALGNVTRYSYDANGNLDLLTVADNSVDPNEKATTDFDYDIRGRKTAETDPLGHKTVFTYDNLDYPATVTLADHLSYALPAGSSSVKTTVYDAEGNLLSETDRVGLSLEYTYTPRNQVETISRRDATGTFGVKTFGYDGNSNLKTESDWKGIVAEHTYNALNQRTATRNRLLDSMYMAYDLAGNPIRVTDYEGRITDYEYDDLNRQTKVIQPQLLNQPARGEIFSTYYLEADPKTNLKTVTDAEEHTTTFEYNGRYQKTKRTNALLDVFEWQYDAAGNLAKEIDEEGGETRYEYDKQNRRTFTYRALNAAVGTFIRDIKMQELRYDAAGNARYVLDGNDNLSETVYDEWNRAWKTITPQDGHAGVAYTTVTELDGAGREVSVSNLAVTAGVDQVRTFVRDGRGLVLTATDAELQPTTFSYDLNDNLEVVTNPLGVKTRHTYDAEDRKKLTTEAEGTTDERISGVLLYDKAGNPLQVRDGNGNIFAAEYNALNLPWKQYDPAPFNANFVETLYDKNGKPVSLKNRLGHVTTSRYDALGRPDLITDPAPFDNQTIVTTYDAVGNVRTVKDKRGIISETVYDSLYRPVEQKRDNVRIVSNEYDDAGNLTATVDAESHRVEYGYNSRNLLERTTYIDGEDNFYTEQFYYGVGKVVSSFNEELEETTFTYDNENRVKTVTFAGEITENFYDALGNLKEVKKPRLNSTTMDYDNLNRLWKVTEGGLLVTEYSYDANNNQRTQTDPRGNVVEYSYDELNRKKSHIQYKPSGNLTVSYDLYDAEGNLRQMTDAKGKLFNYDYDELNRLVKGNYPIVATSFLTIQDVVTGYDANNNVATITETKQISGGGTQTDVTTNNWDNFDRLDDTTQRGITIDYVYDNNGNRSTVITSNGTTTYSYDHRNRLETAVVGVDTTSYTYKPDSLVDTVTYPTGAKATYSYYPTNRVETITHTDGSAATISSYGYQYDDNGNRTQQDEVQGGVSETTTYAYDALDRMESYTLTSGGETTVTSYTFEGHNRKIETVSVNAATTINKIYTYDETNWLTSVVDSIPVPAVTIGYHYDDNGNTILKTDSSKPGEDLVFDYDVANRLVQTTQGLTSLGQYDYNAQGMRVRHYGSERGDVSYYYDDGAVLEEYVDGAGGGLLAHYRYGDRLLSLDNPIEGVQYYHHDALGSTVNLSDSAGGTKVSYQLDPWGHIRNQIGSSVNRQVFTGQEHDEKTGLIYFGARYYDPDTARFMSQDSYLGEAGTPPSLHRYLYAYSNPTVWVDLMGHASIEYFKGFSGANPDWDGADNVLKMGFEDIGDVMSGVSQVADDSIDTTITVLGGTKDVALSAVTLPLLTVERVALFQEFKTLPDYLTKHVAVSIEGYERRWKFSRKAELVDSVLMLWQEVPLIGNFVPGAKGNMNGKVTRWISGGINAESETISDVRDSYTEMALPQDGVDYKYSPNDRDSATRVAMSLALGYRSKGLEMADDIVMGSDPGSTVQIYAHSGGVQRASVATKYIGIYDVGVSKLAADQGPGLGLYNNVGSLQATYSLGLQEPTSDMGGLLFGGYWATGQNNHSFWGEGRQGIVSALVGEPHRQLGSPRNLDPNSSQIGNENRRILNNFMGSP
jgi:RHS repeat-associated protein